MKNDNSPSNTVSYDKRTQESYNGILEEKPYRTAQPRVRFKSVFCQLTFMQKRVTYHHHEDVGNFHFVCRPFLTYIELC